MTGQYTAPLRYLSGFFTNAAGQSAQQKYCFCPLTVRLTVLSVTVTLWPLTGHVASWSARTATPPRVSKAPLSARVRMWDSFNRLPPSPSGECDAGKALALRWMKDDQGTVEPRSPVFHRAYAVEQGHVSRLPGDFSAAETGVPARAVADVGSPPTRPLPLPLPCKERGACGEDPRQNPWFLLPLQG